METRNGLDIRGKQKRLSAMTHQRVGAMFLRLEKCAVLACSDYLSTPPSQRLND